MTPDDFSIALRIRHPSIDPYELSRRLDIAPQYTWRAGEPRRGEDGEPDAGVYRETYWVGFLPKGPPFGPILGRRGPLGVGMLESSLAHPLPTLFFALLKMRRDATFWRELAAQGGTVECLLQVHRADRFDIELSHALLLLLVELKITLSVEVDAALRAAA